MPLTSSPITYPASSPSVPSKRPAPRDAPKNIAKARTTGGFLMDDSSDEEDTNEEPSAKRIMLDHPRKSPSANTRPIPEPTTSEPAIEELAVIDDDDESQDMPDAQRREVVEDPEDTEEARYARLFDRLPTEPQLISSQPLLKRVGYVMATCSGKSVPILVRKQTVVKSYGDMVAARSRTKEGRATKAYYGIDIHELKDAAVKEAQVRTDATTNEPVTANKPLPSVEARTTNLKKPKRTLLWTEKYRARNFMDLVGDDLTNRQVLRWLKRWDPIVFPHASRHKAVSTRRAGGEEEEEKLHRKILMLTGPPGLGKTTLAHVCARQAGYEVMEINASDDRSRDVVRGRIKTSLGTESVKTVEHCKPKPGAKAKIARPVCVVVDEVDGVVSGSGGSGEGGFVKALIELVMTDQKNNAGGGSSTSTRRKKKGDDFRQMRPLILICNDVYHASLRPLRQSGLAEVIHVGKPSVDAVVNRLKTVFEKEGIPCEKDAARKICESAWGMSSGIDAKKGAQSAAEGDLRGVMVVGEWVAGKLRSSLADGPIQLTRQWVDKNIIHDLAHGAGGARGLGRGGSKEIVNRVFQEGAGFPKQADTRVSDKKTRHEQPKTQLGFAEQLKKHGMARLREMVETSGEVDRIMTDVFGEYPNREFNDDSFLSKPDAAYEWLHFHDTCSSRIFSSQEWELGPYLSQAVLACHNLFASPHRRHANAGYDQIRRSAEGDGDAAEAPLPFKGPRADFAAFEAEKQNRAMLQSLQAQLPATLMRSFRSPEHVATDFLPYLVRLISPDVKPTVIGGSSDKGSMASVRKESEKIMVRRAAEVLAEVGIALVKGKIEDANSVVGGRAQWVYRMDPDLDMISTFETAGAHVLATQVPVRYAVRQVLDQELQKTIVLRESAARQARFKGGRPLGGQEGFFDDKENVPAAAKVLGKGGPQLPVVTVVKKDFFGRVIVEKVLPLQETDGNGVVQKRKKDEVNTVWVTYHEGLNNAVKKPVSLEEFMKGL